MLIIAPHFGTLTVKIDIINLPNTTLVVARVGRFIVWRFIVSARNIFFLNVDRAAN